jgi:predicted branched-subunit amino acid permease
MARKIGDHICMPESTQLTAADESSVVPEGRRAQIVAGVTDSFSAGLGIFPFGIALGLLVIQLGLPWWVAPALSLSAFAGSLELLLVGMITSTAPLAAIAVSVFVVNFLARLLRALVSPAPSSEPFRQALCHLRDDR